MATKRQPVKLRLDAEVLEELQKLHPAYGEIQRVVRLLVQQYLVGRRTR